MISQEDLLELIKMRHSGRLYDTTKIISHEQIEMLIEAARWAPSCFGAEPWRYIICNKQDNRDVWDKLLYCLVEANQVWAQNAQILIISLSTKNFRRSKDKSNRWANYDTGAASYGLMLQAAAMGLMAHQMGGFDEKEVRKNFNIGDHLNVISVMAVGYEKKEETDQLQEKERLSKRTRRPIKEIFFYDKLN
ncbi:nitroreductase family protein [Wolbachia endosymbiont of Pentidionis agamae]|uniref:nitroreductase family protein n=1 Tax=Wolbachia endosymbiont of Pentidionis agamae TaxID=3110435 RepID=UPI002FCF3C3F